jgi:hypothetical protein
VGRANWIILALGLLGSLALTFLMQHALKVRGQREIHPVAVELERTFGSRLTGDVDFRLSELGGRQIGTISLRPLIGIGHDRLAREVGQFAWRRLKGETPVAALVVECVLGEDEVQRFQVPPPWDIRTPVRELADGEEPRLPREPSAPSGPSQTPFPGRVGAPGAPPAGKR